jgi:hypothetical protein
MTCPAPDLQPDPDTVVPSVLPAAVTRRCSTARTHRRPFNLPILRDNADAPASSDVTSPSHTPTCHPHPPPFTREWTPPSTCEAGDEVSENLCSSASCDGLAKLSLMYQTAREAAGAVSHDPRSSAYQYAFEKGLSVSPKDLVLRTVMALMKERAEKFHQLCNFRVALNVRVNSLPDVQCRGDHLSRPLPMHFCPMSPPPPCPPPIITINQFRAAPLPLPHGTPEERCRMAEDIAPDLTD